MDSGGGNNSDDNMEWCPRTCYSTERLTVLFGSLVTFRDGVSAESIVSGREASMWDRTLLAIRGRRACPTITKGAAYSFGGGGGGGIGENGGWRKL